VDVILNMSNDYWSLSPVEGRQHGILSLFRSVENQRPVLRSTSSGYTVYIDATGQIQPGALEHYREGTLIARVPCRTSESPSTPGGVTGFPSRV